MRSLGGLVIGLISLVYLTSVYAQTAVSDNDPFRAIVLKTISAQTESMCCLNQRRKPDSVDTEAFLSFEEWKEKQRALAKDRETASERERNGTGNTQPVNNGNSPDGSASSPTSSDSQPAEFHVANSQDTPDGELPPHFRIPLTDRFNYASMDCSARVHMSHKSAKSPSAILSSKKDRYMLSPCSSKEKEPQFVIVELCEDIRIDTVQLANFEFFSGVFKDFTVSVAKTYNEGWTVAGTYKAKNVRGVQSFHPPTSLRDFYRFIRIDFQSHYSNEYYCPISLLRVYGLTHLEEWKWDVWATESRTKISTNSEPQAVLSSTEESPSIDLGGQTSTLKEESHVNSETDNVPDSINTNAATTSSQPSTQVPPESTATRTDISDSTDIPVRTMPADPVGPIVSNNQEVAQSTATLASQQVNTNGAPDVADAGTTEDSLPSTPSPVADPPPSPPSVTPSSKVISADLTTHTVSKLSVSESGSISYANSSAPSSKSSILSSSSSSSQGTQTTTTTTTIIPLVYGAPLPPAPTSGGESIYRLIMNRLSALEGNHTLYAKYVEEQTNSVREMLRRLGEDVGRLEVIGKAQTAMFQRTMTQWEQQRSKFDAEYRELVSRVDYLSDELVMEKRLGIAQLCLLVTVLVFMALTRGSRAEQHGPYLINKSMREWSRRHLSFSGDWVSRFTNASRSRSRSPQPEYRLKSAAEKRLNSDPDTAKLKVEFPSPEPLPKQEPKQEILYDERSLLRTRNHSSSRSRTPSLKTPKRSHFNSHSRTTTPFALTSAVDPSVQHTPRPRLRRANSHGSTGSFLTNTWTGWGQAPRSAKRWARSAHLHEVRSTGGKLRRERDRDEKISARDVNFRAVHGSALDNPGSALDLQDVFASPTTNLAGKKRGKSLNILAERGSISPAVHAEDEDRHASDSPFHPGPSTLRDALTLSPTRSEESEGDLWIDTDFSVNGDEVLEGEL